MAGSDRWYFTKEQLENTPSRRCSIDADKELSYRQQAANFIQDMGQRLQVTQLCINTGIVYMHRFYMFHSFTKFHRNAIAACALFLAAKVEEQPRKLEHVIKVAHMCLHRDNPPLDVKSKAYQDQAHDLVTHENLMLQTLGFNIAVEHPHRFVVNCCQLVRASKDLAQTSYFMATNSLHLTTMCLQYKPTVVACVCIHLACKWSSWEIPTSSEGKDWFYYVDPTVTPELLEELTSEFLAILDKCPSRLKRKIISHNNNNNNNLLGPINSNINSIIKEEKISPNKQAPTKPSSSTLINEPSVSSSNLPQNVPLNVPTTPHVTTPTVTVTEPISRVKNVPNVNTPIMTETISKVKNFTPLTTSTSSSTTLATPNINNSIMKPKNVVPNPNPTTSTVTTTSNFHNVSETSTFVKNVPTVQNVFSSNVNTSETISNVKNASNINTFTPITTVKNETITSAKNDHKVTSPNLIGTLANTLTTKTVPNVCTSNSNAFASNPNPNVFASNSSAFASNSNAFASNSNIFASSSNIFASKSSNETATNINNILNALTSSYDNNEEELMDFDTTESTSELSMSLFNMNNSIASNSIVKERRERPNLEMNKLDKHKETHYHHHHHHKNKHKEKHKKHKEKHKSKHKEKEKYGHSKDGDILKSSSKNISDHHNLVTKIPREKIKLRISKKQIDNNDKSSNNNGNNNDDAKNKGLKLVIKRS